ncbi:MAG: hypothetical protein JWP46_1544 [Modestobacter sp.]|jgi:hypothetical protein|nr:hypothetical protein [Modestobacter sp.]
MSRHPHTSGTLSLFSRARVERRARRALAHELAGYATPAERDELEALIEATGAADDEAARILRSQTQAQLFRVG